MLCQFFITLFDIHMSVHHNIIPSYSPQDATFLDLFISKDTLHVSGDFSAHHQEHTTVQRTSGIVRCFISFMVAGSSSNV
jgi:hypothetical protein